MDKQELQKEMADYLTWLLDSYFNFKFRNAQIAKETGQEPVPESLYDFYSWMKNTSAPDKEN